MYRHFISLTLFVLMPLMAWAQFDSFNQMDEDGNVTRRSTKHNADSLGTDKEIPKGIKVWTVDERFGDIRKAELDTVPHMFMNTIFGTGLRGEYNTLGNVGTPRINRVFIDRQDDGQFLFTQPYDYFVKPVSTFHFTNTLSPFTNLTYNTAGNRTNGEDHFTAKFGVNAGKRLGVGFNFDYIYGRGYYQNQSTSHFNYTMYGSYLGDRYQAHLLFSTNHQKVTENGGITDDNFVLHPESFDDDFATNEIPTVLENNWNRNDNQHVFLSHRYNVGFKRKVKMTEEEIKAKKFAMEAKRDSEERKRREEERRKAEDEGRDFNEDNVKEKKTYAGRPSDAKIAGNEPTATDSIGKGGRINVDSKEMADSLAKVSAKAAADTMWMKDEYVPVTSFIHTMKLDNYKRIYQAYNTPADFYADNYVAGPYAGDSIYDKTSHLRLQNTFAISMLEGFNKWAKAGVKAFVTSDLRRFVLPSSDSNTATTSYNEHNLSVGGQLSKTEGKTLHYNVTAETWLLGEDLGQLKIDGAVDLNFPLFGDTVTLAAKGFFHRNNPTFYYRHYHSRHFWWDNTSLSKELHSRVEGLFSYRKTNTTLRVAFDEIQNYTYLAMGYNIADDHSRKGNTMEVRQKGGAITLLTLSLAQNFKLGPLNWENVITYQKSTDNDVLPVPDLNIYTNLYLRFKIAQVLKCDFGADGRYFTKYYAPDYSPALGQYAVQTGDNRVQTGNYPLVNIYANFHLKHTRFFVMMSHVNAGSGNRQYFLTPHYPLNQRVFRFGLSWNFFN
ncbi:MAG: putative porin [Prevotella sp.]|nr:putative porin [Prevotella sp.]MCI7284558.1 putative porin [Prevotella sp.]MDY3284063.1 putative porin [Prevotella sp.]